MKTNIYSKIMLAAFAAASCVSCTEDTPVLNTETLSEIQFTAVGNVSRTSLADGNAVVWNKSDMIGIFASGDADVYQFTNNLETDGQAEATFTGVAPEDAEAYYALYPYSESSTLNGTTITTVLSGSQTAMAGTFANNLNISVATATAENELQFKNVCGLIKFQLTNVDGITAITLLSNDEGQDISGTLSVDMNSSTATNTEGNNSISLIAENGFQTGADYYMVVPPVTFSNGFKIRLSDGRYAEGRTDYVVEAGKINTISISESDLTQGEVSTKDITISSIEEIAPENGSDRLKLTLPEGVTVGSFDTEDLSDFEITVTNNGDGETKLTVVSVTKVEGANDVIVTLAEDTPVYFDDELSVSYNGDKIKAITGDNVNLSTDDNTTYQGFVNLIYSQDFESYKDSDPLTNFVKWNQEGWSISLSSENESKVLKTYGAKLSGNYLKIEPTVAYKKNGYYTLQLDAYASVGWGAYILLQVENNDSPVAKLSNTKVNTIENLKMDFILENFIYTNTAGTTLDLNGTIALKVCLPTRDDSGWIDNIKLYERDCRNPYTAE